jgi:hypothetical protein
MPRHDRRIKGKKPLQPTDDPVECLSSFFQPLIGLRQPSFSGTTLNDFQLFVEFQSEMSWRW